MPAFLRQSYKIKPQQWGPVSSVQSSIFKNAEREGIDPGSIALCLPMWGPGDQLDYSKNSVVCVNPGGALYNNQELVFNNASSSVLDTNSPLSQFSTGFSCIFESKLNSLSSDSRVVSKFSSTDTLRQFAVWMDAGGTGDGWAISLNGPTGPSNYFENDNDALLNYQKVAFSWDYENIRKYIDGKQVNSATRTDGIYNSNEPVLIGQLGGFESYLNGSLKYLFLFSASLTPSQIAHLSDNPYFLLQRIPTVFYSVPDAGSTLLPNNVNQGQSIDSPALTQLHTLTINNIGQGQTIGELSLSQLHTLITNSINQGQTIDSIELPGLLIIYDILQGQSVQAPTLSQKIALTLQNVSQNQTLNSLTLDQLHGLICENVAQGQTVDTASMEQLITLAIESVSQGQDIDELSFLQYSLITVDDVTQTQDLGILTVTQLSSLIVDNIAQGQTIESINFSIVKGLVTVTITAKAPGVIFDGRAPRVTFN